MTKRWRIGIIGCGWAGSQHAQAIQKLAHRVELCAVADINAEVAAAKAKEWQAPMWTDDYRQLLDRELLDAVTVCTPHNLHAQSAIAAAEAGCHVLVEKPLAVTLSEADAMIAAAETAGITLMVAETVRFHPTYQRVAGWMQSGALGDVFLIRIAREHQMHDYLQQRPWFLTEPSGGIMYSGGIHDFEILRMLAGEVEHVYGLAAPKVLKGMVADDTSVALVGMQSGVSAVIVESFSLRTPQPGVHGTVHGTLGSLWFYGNWIERYSAPADGQQHLVETLVIPPIDGFEAEMAHFLDCLEQQAQPMTSGRDQRKPLVAVLATYESMRRGERVYLQEFESIRRL
ncbi:MAG: Gfo/Idh/MocA family protein [Candidatus Poribacteria bacterium]